jgi:hypothetical protein
LDEAAHSIWAFTYLDLPYIFLFEHGRIGEPDVEDHRSAPAFFISGGVA